jgi:outer membrane protein assembly factor BamE
MAGLLSTFNTLWRARRLARAPLALFSALALGGCSMLPSLPSWPSLPSLPSLQSGESFLGVVTPYRMDIVQGNVVTKEQAAYVKPGMSRLQVRDILGSPMLTDVFHADRWDYVFTIKRQGTEPQRRAVVVYFKDDKLERLDAPELPSEQEFVASISQVKPSGKKPVLELTAEQKAALPVPPKPAAEPVVPMGAVRTYPPLEPS